MQPSSGITDDFNETAKAFLKKDASSSLLLAKYSLLLNFKATDAQQKEELTAAMFDCGIKFLSARADDSYRGYLTDGDYDAAAALLKRLAKPDSAPFLPNRAAEELAKVGFDFIRSAEKSGGGIDGQKLTRYAALCVEYAEQIRDITKEHTETLATGKNITPAKRIVLKHKDP
jgi:hypothetical protein